MKNMKDPGSAVTASSHVSDLLLAVSHLGMTSDLPVGKLSQRSKQVFYFLSPNKRGKYQ